MQHLVAAASQSTLSHWFLQVFNWRQRDGKYQTFLIFAIGAQGDHNQLGSVLGLNIVCCVASLSRCRWIAHTFKLQTPETNELMNGEECQPAAAAEGHQRFVANAFSSHCAFVLTIIHFRP